MSHAHYMFVYMLFSWVCDPPRDVCTCCCACGLCSYCTKLCVDFILSVLLLTMVNYMFAEYADMVLLYGKARCNKRPSCQLYAERFPHCQTLLYTPDCRVPQRHHTPKFEEVVFHAVEEDVTMSTRNIAGRLNVDHPTVWHVLHEQQLHTYHPQKVQAMQILWHEPDFPGRILFTDEAKVTREAVLNSRNSHVWADENPHASCPHGFQKWYSLNTWTGFLDGCVIGP